MPWSLATLCLRESNRKMDRYIQYISIQSWLRFLFDLSARQTSTSQKVSQAQRHTTFGSMFASLEIVDSNIHGAVRLVLFVLRIR